MRKFTCLLIGLLCLAAAPTQAMVVVMPPGSTTDNLTGWKARAIDLSAPVFGTGPARFDRSVTFSSNTSASFIGSDDFYSFGSAGAWSGVPMAGLNAAQGSVTFVFDSPVSAILADINWRAGESDGQPITMAIYDTFGELLETRVLSGGPDGDLAGFLGFARDEADIGSFVLTNGFIGARNLFTKAPNRMRFSWSSSIGGPDEPSLDDAPPLAQSAPPAPAPAPEPTLWSLMIGGFLAAGAQVRRRRRLGAA